MFILSSKTRSNPQILNYQSLCSVLSRTTNIPSIRREWSTATNISIKILSIIITFEELNDEGSDTVFHAQNAVSKSLHDHYTHRDAAGLRASDLDIKNVKIHCSCCGIENFVETPLCKMCL